MMPALALKGQRCNLWRAPPAAVCERSQSGLQDGRAGFSCPPDRHLSRSCSTRSSESPVNRGGCHKRPHQMRRFRPGCHIR
jgi:hypothetical protein